MVIYEMGEELRTADLGSDIASQIAEQILVIVCGEAISLFFAYFLVVLVSILVGHESSAIQTLKDLRILDAGLCIFRRPECVGQLARTQAF